MSISNKTAGFRPGVCTSTTRPTAPFNGQVIYETDTGKTQVWNGTAWVMLTNSTTPPGLQFIKSQTVGTSETPVTVSNVFSSDFTNYRIIMNNISAGAAASGVYIKFNNSTGSTYNGGGYWRKYSDGTFSGTNLNASSTGIFIGLSGTSSDIFISVDVFGPNLAKFTGVTSNYSYADYMGNGGGVETTNTSQTGFNLIVTTTNFTGGTIKVYGYRD